MKRTVLPFTAIVGQERLKKALLLNAINPNLRGVLIKGERGTAKSTAVRALAELLPEIEVVTDCPFNCHPNDPTKQCESCRKRVKSGEDLPFIRRKMRVVDLPLGATEDRIVGTLDIERALKEGLKALQPGLLAEANRGILYIDEINLLDDHLVDVLLDAAAMGVNVVEREGISVSHPARFMLVGTMNPDEGELRPQLLDRIGLQVDVEGIKDIAERVHIIRVVEEFERDPLGFSRRYESEQRELRDRILRAQELLPEVRMDDELLELTAKICLELNVDGHRADILIARCAKTIAAYNLRDVVTEDEVREAASFVLPHRIKTPLFEEPPDVQQVLDELMSHQHDDGEDEGDGGQSDDEPDPDSGTGNGERRFDIGRSLKPKLNPQMDRKLRMGYGKRAKTISTGSGKYVDFKMPKGTPSDVAIDATLRASATRGSVKNGIPYVEPQDIREKVRERRKSATILFVVDASGSMGAQRRMETAKGVVLELLRESYQKRDKIAFVAFRGNDAHLLLPFTSSLKLAIERLRELPTGGKTPLGAGLKKGLELLKAEMRKDPNVYPMMVLVSDGKANVPIKDDVKSEIAALSRKIREMGIHLAVVDSGSGFLKLGYNEMIVELSGGEYHSLEEINGIIKGLKD